MAPSAPSAPPPVTRTITLAEGMTVADLALKLDVKAKDVLKKLTAVSLAAFCDGGCTPVQGTVVVDNITFEK